jgi:hypothetical protein
MPKLSNEAYKFRGELLNIGGTVTASLVACLTKDPSATNQIIQLIYDKFQGNFCNESALYLAYSTLWILSDKPDDKATKDKLWDTVSNAFIMHLN